MRHRGLIIWDFDGTLGHRPGSWAGAILEALGRARPDITVGHEAIRGHIQSGFPWHEPEILRPKRDPDAWWTELAPVLISALQTAAGLAESEALAGTVKLRWHLGELPVTTAVPSYRGFRFPPEIISHAVWLYHRFSLSFRDVEELLSERGVQFSYEAIRQWCLKFGPEYARRLKRRQGRLGDTWHLDEVFVKIRGELHYLWRAVDQDGDVIDILVQKRRDRKAAARFFRQLMKGQGSWPGRIVTDKLGSYAAARRVVMPSVPHDTARHANNRAEVSHEPTRQQERSMRRFKSMAQAQRFLSLHGLVQNLFRLGRHMLSSANYRLLRTRSLAAWRLAAHA